ncbi:MAG: ribonuclease E/G, partial [Betaproteobacteria bacterium]|nr:ribonuclease E/G [Betaproteobacteria bacterium]
AGLDASAVEVQRVAQAVFHFALDLGRFHVDEIDHDQAAEGAQSQLTGDFVGGLIVIDFFDLESTKNQREVENRLRDALHFDRARVQTGKISRFGLLELSRQRLRPALAETSYITCPRCTGTGHIRSTESAALHILRILEEEAMKENTGALHCQVPVDVGTFLLNEKRVDISRIEMRHRVNLVIVPNRHLETPAHEIVRLRHDQLNAEGIVLASYQMAEKPVEEAYQPPSAADAKPARTEAAVKGITPDSPAPIVEPKAVVAAPSAAANEGGFFGRIVSFFMGDKKTPAPAAAEDKSDRPPRRDSGRERDRNRDGGRGGRDRNSRREGGDRKDRGEQTPRPQAKREEQQIEGSNRKPREPREPREPKEAREPREPREPKEAREPRPPREPREPRPPRADASAVQNGVSPAPTSGTEGGQDGEARSGRRSRGRGRGRGRSEEGSTTEVAAAGTDAATAGVSAAASFVAQSAGTITDVAVTAPVPIAQQAAIEPTPAAVQEAASAAFAPAATFEPTAAPVAAEPSPQPEAVAEAAVVAMPPPAADPIVVPPASVPAVVDIKESLQQIGLVMIETSHAAPVADSFAPAQPLGRKPKPAPVLANEPLQMVETKHD